MQEIVDAEDEVNPSTGHEGPEWGGWLTSRPGHFTPGKENRYPKYWWLLEAVIIIIIIIIIIINRMEYNTQGQD
jgi:hypothetical protein